MKAQGAVVGESMIMVDTDEVGIGQQTASHQGDGRQE